MTRIAGLLKPRAPVNLDEVLATALGGWHHSGAVPGAAEPEDIADIEAGVIHPKTLHAYAESFAEGDAVEAACPGGGAITRGAVEAADLKEHFEEARQSCKF